MTAYNVPLLLRDLDTATAEWYRWQCAIIGERSGNITRDRKIVRDTVNAMRESWGLPAIVPDWEELHALADD